MITEYYSGEIINHFNNVGDEKAAGVLAQSENTRFCFVQQSGSIQLPSLITSYVEKAFSDCSQEYLQLASLIKYYTEHQRVYL